MQICFDFPVRLLCNEQENFRVVVFFTKIHIAPLFSREHVYQYVEFVRTVLKEAEQLNHYGAHLCATVRNMMELFHVISGNLHEKKSTRLLYLTGKQSLHTTNACSFLD